MTKKRRRCVHLHVMVTPEEQALIGERMAEAGISNMGAYMRKMALNGYVLHVDLSDIRELVSLQRRCANNLNHIYYNSTSLDCSHKFRDFIGSARAVRRLSDRVCLENDLSVITSPKLHSKGRFLHYGAWLGTERQPSYKERLRAAICDALAKGPDSFDAFLRLMEESGYAVKRGRGGAISFLVPGQQRATRLRSSTLGEGFDPGDIRDVIAGKRPLPKLDAPAPAAPRRVDLIVDIQERLRSGKGPAYERWAKVYKIEFLGVVV